MLLRDVLNYLFDALDAATPAADQAQKDVVCDVWAYLALPHVVVQLSQRVRNFDEQSVQIDLFELFDLNFCVFGVETSENGIDLVHFFLRKGQPLNFLIDFPLQKVLF
jgi:hypothetical protein